MCFSSYANYFQYKFLQPIMWCTKIMRKMSSTFFSNKLFWSTGGTLENTKLLNNCSCFRIAPSRNLWSLKSVKIRRSSGKLPFYFKLFFMVFDGLFNNVIPSCLFVLMFILLLLMKCVHTIHKKVRLMEK